ncbi:thermonuclease family protein [Kaustia mangrovi]|uniref:Thermonuclease family protein n=2 Tax=Kaustia mangrovi TaxID=2593653 RepID=A0A7S8HEE8_9HYPH|nr:thermonuclease family protein [Kaustia mangrovi]
MRLLDIDTPEIDSPRCDVEEDLGHLAAERLSRLIADRLVVIDRSGTHDRWGRPLVRLIVGDEDIGDILVREGLAVRWEPGREAWEARARHWCGDDWRAEE